MSLSSAIKSVIRTTLYRSGVLGVWHRHRNKRALTVLMFHRVLPAGSEALAYSEREFAFSVEGFQKTLDFVARHYNVVDLAQVKVVIDDGSAVAQAIAIPMRHYDGERDLPQSSAERLVEDPVRVRVTSA